MSSTTMCGHLTTLISMHTAYVYVVGQSSAAVIHGCGETIISMTVVWHFHSAFQPFCVTRSWLCFCFASQKSDFDSYNLFRRNESDFLHLHWKILQIWDDGQWKNHNPKQEKSGVHGLWVWLPLLLFENIIYIFLRNSLLNFFVYCFSFFNLLCGVLHRGNKMKDILREAVVETITIMFCPLITIEGACDCVWVRVSECLCAYIKV